MPRSVLLQLARDSIEEVLQAEINIDRAALLKEHPLLNEQLAITINLYLENGCKGSYTTQNPTASLLSNIILGAKKAAFEDTSTPTITTAEYLHSEIELILHTTEKMAQRDPAIIQTPYTQEETIK